MEKFFYTVQEANINITMASHKKFALDCLPSSVWQQNRTRVTFKVISMYKGPSNTQM